jgi:hypothetical protein
MGRAGGFVEAGSGVGSGRELCSSSLPSLQASRASRGSALESRTMRGRDIRRAAYTAWHNLARRQDAGFTGFLGVAPWHAACCHRSSCLKVPRFRRFACSGPRARSRSLRCRCFSRRGRRVRMNARATRTAGSALRAKRSSPRRRPPAPGGLAALRVGQQRARASVVLQVQALAALPAPSETEAPAWVSGAATPRAAFLRRAERAGHQQRLAATPSARSRRNRPSSVRPTASTRRYARRRRALRIPSVRRVMSVRRLAASVRAAARTCRFAATSCAQRARIARSTAIRAIGAARPAIGVARRTRTADLVTNVIS